MKRSLLKACSLIAGMSVLFTSLAFNSKPVKVQAATMRSASQIVQDMGVGWNLGNTLDSRTLTLSYNASPSEHETSWGNPVTTKAMIDKVAAAGFRTIRIPTTWGTHMDGNGNVNAAWMNRVQDVVDYCMANGVYVILNVHHDSNWCVPDYAHQNQVTPRLQKLWSQIAARFKNYDDHLIFETLNEPRVEGSAAEWSGGTAEGRDVVNKYNAAALQTIRQSGGNNASRAVMIPTYAASTTSPALNDFKVPNDKNIIASIHAYSPYTFCGDIKSNVNSWGSAQDKSALDSEMDYYANTFRSKGIPVVMGEYGSINKNNTSSRVAHAEYYTKAALSRGIACVWWDNGQSTPNKEETFGIFDRNSLSWCQSSIKDALIRAYKAVHPNAPTPTPNPEDPTPTNPVPGNTANLKDGWYYIKNVNAQKYLQVANNTGNNGQNVELRAGSGLAGQRWYLTNLGNGYISLKSGLGNYMLDIANGKNENGANVQIYSPNSMDPQKFMLKTTSTNNTYVIATKCSNITKVLDDEKNGTTNGTNVCQWTYGGKANQQWVFEAINGSTTPTDPVPNPPATNSKLKLTYTINNWGSAYQVNFKVTNNSTSNVNGWTLKIKKSDINISSSWNVNVKEDGNYYVITPVNWNANIAKGSSVDFGVQGNGSIGSSINYELN